MRIISGKFKSRKIVSGNYKQLRPTLDRVKQTIFDILFNYINIEDKIVLDGFAGTGNLGIEAISRYASKCYFVDNHYDSIQIIKKNIRNLDIKENSILIKKNFYKFIKNFKKYEFFNLVFLDPPYKQDHIGKILNNDYFNRLCKNGAIVIAEVEKNYNISYNENWETINQREISNTMVYFLKKRKG